jgi:hypothetical protein
MAAEFLEFEHKFHRVAEAFGVGVSCGVIVRFARDLDEKLGVLWMRDEGRFAGHCVVLRVARFLAVKSGAAVVFRGRRFRRAVGVKLGHDREYGRARTIVNAEHDDGTIRSDGDNRTAG